MKYYYGNTYKEALSNEPVEIKSTKQLQQYEDIYEVVVPANDIDDIDQEDEALDECNDDTEVKEILDGKFFEENYDDNNKMTNYGVQKRIEYEGIGYAILHWRIEGKDCRNPKLGKLIDEAYVSLKAVEDYLDDVVKRELPTTVVYDEIVILDDEDADDIIVERLSDDYGYCVKNFNFKLKDLNSDIEPTYQATITNIVWDVDDDENYDDKEDDDND